MKNLSHFSKTDIRFWQNAIFRQAYTVDGRHCLTKEWYARMQFRGKREFFSLGTPNKAAAASRARDIYLSLVASGWDATLARFKKPGAPKRALDAGRSYTVGQFLEAIAQTTTNQSTLEDYAPAFRQIVSEIFCLSNNNLKYDYQSGGRVEWLSKVHAISLAEVTPAKVQEWKRSFLARGWFGRRCSADRADIRERHFETRTQLVFAQEAATSAVNVTKSVALRRN
jgi:hypothetical protein